MLKERAIETKAGEFSTLLAKRRSSTETDGLKLMNAVVKANPQFKRLDGLLTGLADACMNGGTGKQGRVVGVCSAVQGEGKTTVSMGLASAIARRAASEVLLFETDLASPNLAEDLQLPNREGLAECLDGSRWWTDVVQKTPLEHLSVIAAGFTAQDPLALLDKPELDLLVSELRGSYKHIVVDMPAILEREDAGRLVELVDAVVFLIGAGKVSQEIVESGIQAVGRDKLMGVVLNGAWSHAPSWISRIVGTDGFSKNGHS